MSTGGHLNLMNIFTFSEKNGVTPVTMLWVVLRVLLGYLSQKSLYDILIAGCVL